MCEQFAHGRYMKVEWPGVEPERDRESNALNIIPPRRDTRVTL